MNDFLPKQKKGRFVYAGGWGCVFTNESSMCIPDDEEKFLLKINRDEVKAQEEWEIGQILAEIDPDQKHFVYPNYHCHVRVGDIKRLNYYSYSCSFLNSLADDDMIRVLYMINGGRTLEDYFIRNEESNKTWSFVSKNIFYPLVKDLQVLFKAGYMHHDVKGDNVVYDFTPGNRKGKEEKIKVRLIDFGIMIPKREYFSEKYDIMLQIGQGQSWNPPENRFVFELDRIYEKVISPSQSVQEEQLPRFFMNLYEKEMDKLNYKISDKNKDTVSFMLIDYVFGRDKYLELYTNAILDFIDEFFDYENSQIMFKKLSSFADRVDVYGVGILILEMYDFLVFENDKQEKEYKNVLFHCLHPNILKRSSLSDLLHLLD